MLDALKLVNRATADKDVIRMLTHICVYDGKIQGADSKMAIEVDCPDLDGHSFTAPAEKFIKAVNACNGSPTIVVNADGTIKISQKRFRVTLPSLNVKDYPRQTFKPDNAVQVTVPDNFLSGLRKLYPFISQDASRPWSLGICTRPGYFYATNNVTMARVAMAWDGPVINLPGYIVQEVLEINQPVLEIWVSDSSISFKFQGAWLRAQLYTDKWPDSVSKMFDVKREFQKVPDDLLNAVDQLIPFCPDVKFPSIFFKDGSITTANGLQSAEIGFDWKGVGVYRAEVLKLVLGVALEWTPGEYPKPVFFKGNGIEGMMVGVRQ